MTPANPLVDRVIGGGAASVPALAHDAGHDRGDSQEPRVALIALIRGADRDLQMAQGQVRSGDERGGACQERGEVDTGRRAGRCVHWGVGKDIPACYHGKGHIGCRRRSQGGSLIVRGRRRRVCGRREWQTGAESAQHSHRADGAQENAHGRRHEKPGMVVAPNGAAPVPDTHISIVSGGASSARRAPRLVLWSTTQLPHGIPPTP
jgi:hypothetical protein